MRLPTCCALLCALIVSASAAPTELVGKWTSKKRREVTEFTADGKLKSGSGEGAVAGSYHCEGDRVFLKFEGAGAPPVIERKYTVAEGRLTLENPDTHEKTELERVVTKPKK
jgi:hypothetical protein